MLLKTGFFTYNNCVQHVIYTGYTSSFYITGKICILPVR